MATSKKFSELPVASSMNNGDLFAVAQEDAQAETGYTSKSATALVVGKKLNGEIEYATDLPSFPPGDQNPLDALEYLNSKINDLYPVDSASGSIANFTTSLALPLVALKTNIVAQGGGGTPSAPVAITGVSEMNVYRRGVNLWNEEWEAGEYDITNGNKINTVGVRCKEKIAIKGGATYRVYSLSGTTNDNVGCCFYDENETFIRGNVIKNRATITAPDNARYLTFFMPNSWYGSTYNNDTAILNASGASSYAPYNPNSDTFILNLGQTIYGGYVDWENGKLVITWGITDLSTLEWSYNSSYNCWRFNNFNDLKVIDNATPVNALAEQFTVVKAQGYTSLHEHNTICANTSKTIFCDNNSTEDEPSGYFAYELATPIEIDLPTTMPSTISGVQNWFADSGDIELEYKMGVQEYIDKKIAEVQALVL